MNDKMKPLSEVVEELQKRGYTENFIFVDNTLRTEDEDGGYKPGEITIEREYRFEGMSDPEDSSILYAVTTRDDKQGVIVNSYGPDANLELNEFLKNCNQTKNGDDD
ncbi:hypothetical protein [Fulvivirga sp.]|jgi:hypothetical protein|uniref:hypothetical protein n=1 Tax=Fulvivirga sp. TaxID=1931237 RepID=UPI0032EF1241